MRGLKYKFKLPAFYEEDVRVELIHRRKVTRFVTWYLYLPKGTKETGTMRTDIKDPLRKVPRRIGFAWLFMQKQKLKYFYRFYVEKYFYKVVKKLRRKHKRSMSLSFMFLGYVESRLDLLFYRSNYAQSLVTARNYISHGLVNIFHTNVKKIGHHVKYFEVFYPKAELHGKIKKRIRQRIYKKLFFHKYPLYMEVSYKILHTLFLTIKHTSKVFFPFKRRQRELFRRGISRWGNPYKRRVVNSRYSSVYDYGYYINRR